MVLALLLCGAVVLLVLAGLFAFGVRRRLIQRSGGTFDCNLRWEVSRAGGGRNPAAKAGRTASPATTVTRSSGSGSSPTPPAPAASWSAAPSRCCERRPPQGEEELALSSDAIVLACAAPARGWNWRMSEDALTGFLAWLEAAPPGQRVNVA